MPIPATSPLVTIPVSTPFDEQDRVDFEALVANVQRWMTTPLSGYIVGTASGEEWFISEEEKLRIAKTVGETLGDKQFLVGGIDCPSVTETLRKADAFAEVGAGVLRVRIPRYEATVATYYEEVLKRCPLPVLVMHQCNPERFGFAGEPAASPEAIGRICSMDKIFGYVSDHDVRFEARVRRCVPDDKQFWICNGSMILFGTTIGCNGTTTAFANVWPDALDRLLRLGMAGQYEEARPLQDAVQRIDAVMLKYGAAGIKAALGLLGFEGTRPRAPTRPMPSEDVALLETEMRRAGLLAG